MSVTLYLMRHGIAADAEAGMSDADRALTAEGIRKTTRVAVGLQTIGVTPEIILSSPLRRADETARLVAEVLAPKLQVEHYAPLAGGVPVEEVLRNLRPSRRAHGIILVGHQPDLGHLASYLMTGSATLAPLPFRKASVAAISVAGVPPKGTGSLEWFLTPGQLRAIADSRD